MADETVVRVSADVAGYISEIERARKSAADFAAGQDALKQRLTNSVAVVDASRKAIKEHGDEALNSFNKSAKSAERWLSQLQRQAAEAGKTREELLRMRAAELGVSDAAETWIKQIETVNVSHRKLQDGVGMSAAAMNAAMRSVPAQMTDIVTQLAGGQSPLLVMTQQGGQLKDMFGGLVPAIKATATYIASLVTPTTIVAAGVAALGYAYYAGNKEAKEFNATLALSSNYAGLTASSFQVLTQRLATDANTSFGNARDVLLGFAKSGELTGSEMEGLANLVVRTARVSGDALEDVSKDYAKLAQDPAKWAVEHNQSMHFMDVATYQHIQALQEAGDKHAAIQAVIDAATAQIANSSIENLSKAGKAWRDLSAGVQQFWAELKKGMSTGPTLQDRIDTLMGERKDIQGNGLASGRVADIDRQVALLQEQQRVEQRAAESQARTAQIQQAAVEAEVRVDKLRDQVMSNAQRRQKELDNLNRDRAAILAGGGTFSDADYGKLVADINDKYKDPKTAKPKVYQDDAATKFLQQLRDQQAADQAALDSNEKLTQAQKQQAEFLQKISDLKGKSILMADQKSLLANQDAIKAQLASNVETERALKLKTDIQKVEERSAAINAQIGNYQASQAEQYQRQLDAIGKGADAQKQAEAVKSIYREYQQLQLQLEKATPIGARDSDAYQKAQKDIQAGLQQSLTDYAAYYAQLKLKQDDWSNGATEAVANYVEVSRNKMAQASNYATNLFKGMEDAIVNFAMTGKLNFSEFAKSVIADLIRIQARAAVSGLAQAGLSALGGLFGNAGTAATYGTNPGSQQTAMLAAQDSGMSFAVGGRPPIGMASLVGERGPEMFVPDTAGTIVPNDALRSGGGGGNVSIVQHITVDSRSDQASIMQAMAAAKEAAKREIQEDFRRGGPTSRLAGR